ncbi:hypothetical protein KBD18_01205, partial [Patescibacteria group bacterium]|nr:hypothetical protein [Patescibacteria group bacterium]
MTEQRVPFSCRTPAEMVRTVQAVALLFAESTDEDARTQINVLGLGQKDDHGPPLSGSLLDAIRALQEAGIKAEWFHKARIRWFDLALAAWDEATTTLEKQGESCARDAVSRLLADPPSSIPITTLQSQLYPHFLEQGYTAASDRWLRLLMRLRKIARSEDSVRQT